MIFGENLWTQKPQKKGRCLLVVGISEVYWTQPKKNKKAIKPDSKWQPNENQIFCYLLFISTFFLFSRLCLKISSERNENFYELCFLGSLIFIVLVSFEDKREKLWWDFKTFFHGFMQNTSRKIAWSVAENHPRSSNLTVNLNMREWKSEKNPWME